MDRGALNRAMLLATHAAAGEIQREIAEIGAIHVSEADLRRALRSGLQSQLGPVVRAETPTPKTSSWSGRIGGIDVGILQGDHVFAGVEVKWCRGRDKLAEGLWDALKLAPLTIDDGQLVAAYLVYGAPASTWQAADQLPVELFSSTDHDIRDLLGRHDKYWRWLLTGNKSARPVEMRHRFTTTSVADVAIHDAAGECWALRAVRIESQPGKILFFEDGLIAGDQPAFGEPAPASRYVDGEDDFQIDPATLPENRGLL